MKDLLCHLLHDMINIVEAFRKLPPTRPIGPVLQAPDYRHELEELSQLHEEVVALGHMVVPTENVLNRFDRIVTNYGRVLSEEVGNIYHLPTSQPVAAVPPTRQTPSSVATLGRGTEKFSVAVGWRATAHHIRNVEEAIV